MFPIDLNAKFDIGECQSSGGYWVRRMRQLRTVERMRQKTLCDVTIPKQMRKSVYLRLRFDAKSEFQLSAKKLLKAQQRTA